MRRMVNDCGHEARSRKSAPPWLTLIITMAASLAVIAVTVVLPSSALATELLSRESGVTYTSVHGAENTSPGCFDLSLWVLSAPRAQRIAVPVVATRPCEIGAEGCERAAESLTTADRLSDGARFSCQLKQELDELDTNDAPAVDEDGCVTSERQERSTAIDTGAFLSLSPSSNTPAAEVGQPICLVNDAACSSLPGPNQVSPELSAAPPFLFKSRPVSDAEVDARAFWSRYSRTELSGFSTDVDRPPTAI